MEQKMGASDIQDFLQSRQRYEIQAKKVFVSLFAMKKPSEERGFRFLMLGKV